MTLEVIEGGAKNASIIRPPEFSDESLALRFAARHEADLRHVASWGKWLVYQDGQWHFDTTLEAFSINRRRNQLNQHIE